MNSVVLPGAAGLEGTPAPTDAVRLMPSGHAPVSRHVAHHLVAGTSALGLGIVIERGFGFLANILAARLGGATAFGAYSLGISTANNISSYAAGGIGATAARFSGKYPWGSSAYGTLARALAIVSVCSAVLAALALWLGAAPLAQLLRKPGLTVLLEWAAVSAAGIILVECARGFFVGQRRFPALVLLSVLVGAGMVTLLPLAARHHDPIRMIISQGLVTTAAVAVCLLLARPLGLVAPPAEAPAAPLAPMLREVWGFGLVQLAGLVAANLSGWWVTTLVARADTTLVQMSFFAIASQMRNLVGLAPGLLTETSYAVMAAPQADESGRTDAGTPHHVMAVCTFFSTGSSVLLAAAGVVLLPWLLRLLYGRSYTDAASTVAVALAIAVAHMGNAPAAARLSIVSIRVTGLINTVWAVFVAVAGTLVLLHHGSATTGMLIYFAAHVLSAALVLLVLRQRDYVPRGMVATFLLGTGTSGLLAVLAMLRAHQPQRTLLFTSLMGLLFAAAVACLFALGRQHRWLPTRSALRQLGLTVRGRFVALFGSRLEGGAGA